VLCSFWIPPFSLKLKNYFILPLILLLFQNIGRLLLGNIRKWVLGKFDLSCKKFKTLFGAPYGAVDFRYRHFAFRGAALSLLVAVAPAGSQLCRSNPAGVFVPSTAINRALKGF
jgi:ABC-type branched-subunit amino acid transport system permease subunit